MQTFQTMPTISTNSTDLVFYCLIPVEKFSSKKNSKKIMINRNTNRPFIGQNKQDAAILKHLVQNFRLHSKQIDGPIDYPVVATMRFHYPLTKKNEIPRKVMDLSNLYQGPEDALQAAGVLLDDRFIESHNGSCRVYGAPQKALEVALFRCRQVLYAPSSST